MHRGGDGRSAKQRDRRLELGDRTCCKGAPMCPRASPRTSSLALDFARTLSAHDAAYKGDPAVACRARKISHVDGGATALHYRISDGRGRDDSSTRTATIEEGGRRVAERRFWLPVTSEARTTRNEKAYTHIA
eukprot:scaffold1728_cov116-Isochrysis_galbana.AAC.10